MRKPPGTLARAAAVLATAAGGLAAACSGRDEGRPPQGGVTGSDKARAAGDAPSADVAALVSGNSAFALDLYRAVRDQPGNLFMSPYSVSGALAMTLAGARGATAQQMGDVLHFTLPPVRLHPAWNALDLALSARGGAQDDMGDYAFRLQVADALWGQSGWTFLPAFVDVLAENYGTSGPRLVNFASDPEGSRRTINAWVSDKTAGLVPELLPMRVLNDGTRFVLTNAISFRAAWEQPFDTASTTARPFHRLDGSDADVPTMFTRLDARMATGDGFQVIEIPYRGGELSMVVIVPDLGAFAAFEARFDGGRLAAILASLGRADVELLLPRFSIRTPLRLTDVLQAMGMVDAFAPGRADFSGIDGTRQLSLSDVVHEAFVSVTEKGTEAGAATAVIGGDEFGPLRVAVDRPFVFFIRDIASGTILFLGRVVDPGA